MGQFIGVDFSFLPQVFLMREIPLIEQRFILDKLSLISSIAVELWNRKKDD